MNVISPIERLFPEHAVSLKHKRYATIPPPPPDTIYILYQYIGIFSGDFSRFKGF